MIPRGFTLPVAAAIGAGLAAGLLCHDGGPIAAAAAGLCGGLAELFLRGVQGLMAPMILVTIVAGIGGLPAGSAGQVGSAGQAGPPAWLTRAGWCLPAWFAGGAVVAVAVGAAVALGLPWAAEFGSGFGGAPAGTGQDLAVTLSGGILPGGTLPVAVFAVAFGIALHTVRGVLSNTLVAAAEEGVIVLLALLRLLARLAPGAAFCAGVALAARHGTEVIPAYAALAAGGLLGLGAMALALCGVAGLVLGREAPEFLASLREPLATGFATASSESAFPRLMEQLDEWGVPGRLSSLVLPLGHVFNLCGSGVYLAFATVFLARLYGVKLTAPELVGALAVAALAARGLAGIPRAAPAALAAVLPALGLPAEAALLLLGIDAFLDMGRTAVNVLGNAVAAVALARWTAPRAVADGASVTAASVTASAWGGREP